MDHLSVESLVLVSEDTPDRSLLTHWLRMVGLPVLVTEAEQVERTFSSRRSSLYLTVGRADKIIFTKVTVLNVASEVFFFLLRNIRRISSPPPTIGSWLQTL